jgi:hypothetical protein
LVGWSVGWSVGWLFGWLAGGLWLYWTFDHRRLFCMREAGCRMVRVRAELSGHNATAPFHPERMAMTTAKEGIQPVRRRNPASTTSHLWQCTWPNHECFAQLIGVKKSEATWLVGGLVGWVAGWLVGWLAGWLVRWLVDCLAGWLAGWLAGGVLCVVCCLMVVGWVLEVC